MPKYWMVTVEDRNLSWSLYVYYIYTAFIDVHPSIWIQEGKNKNQPHFILFAMECSKEAYDLHHEGPKEEKKDE